MNSEAPPSAAVTALLDQYAAYLIAEHYYPLEYLEDLARVEWVSPARIQIDHEKATRGPLRLLEDKK